MSDYEKLLAGLNTCAGRGNSCAGCSYHCGTAKCVKDLIGDAADALVQQRAEIERLSAEADRLTKERDQWKMLGELANKRAEDYREMRRQRDNAAECNARLIADVARLEAESRAKEQYIAEHMGGTAERNARMKRDAERLRGTRKNK